MKTGAFALLCVIVALTGCAVIPVPVPGYVVVQPVPVYASPFLVQPYQTMYWPSPYSSAPAIQFWLDTGGRYYHGPRFHWR